MSRSAPAISVIMAAYNGGTMIGDTIASVLAQTHNDFELIIVDDASKDDTLARVRAIPDPRIVLIPATSNGGPVAARNIAFAAARGKFIVGLDQDDLCHPTRFAVQRAYLEAHPEVVLVASTADFLEDGTIYPPRAPFGTSPGLIDWRLQLYNPIVWSSVMFRAEAARQLAPFERQERLYAEDFDLYHRIGQFGTIARIDTPLVTYRMHAAGASQTGKARMLDSAAAVLADNYGDIFGDQAGAAATLVTRYFASGEPIPDEATLDQVTDVLAEIHQHFVATRRPGRAARAQIMAEYSRLWWRMAHATIRTGLLSLPHMVGARPAGTPIVGDAAAHTVAYALIGTGRAYQTQRKLAS